ncbi:hypothetical protein MAR_019238, partial [Mya arenaria]
MRDISLRLYRRKVKESGGTKKSTGPSMKDVDKLQKENESLRTELQVASGQVAYLRENLDPSAFEKAAGITPQDGNHLYQDAMRKAEKIINEQKHELEELKRNKQSQEKEMAGKKGNEKDGSKQEIVQLESKIEILKKGRDNLKEKFIHINRKIPQFFSQRPVKCTIIIHEVEVFTKINCCFVLEFILLRGDEIKRLKDENEKITKDAKLDLEQTKQKLSISLDEGKRLNELKRLKDENEKITKDAKKRVDENHAKADRNNTNASQSSSSESEKNNGAQAKSTWERKYDETLKKHQAEMDKLQKENDATLDKKDKYVKSEDDWLKRINHIFHRKYDEMLKKHHEEMEKLRKENDATLDKRDKKYDEMLKKHQEEMEKLRKENDANMDKKDNEISKLQDEKKDLEKEISQLKTEKKVQEKMKASPPQRDQTHNEGNEEFRKKLKDAQEEITELRN